MSFTVKVEDVKQFLVQKGCLWDGNNAGDSRKARDEDFNQAFRSVTLEVTTMKTSSWYLEVKVNPTMFVTLRDDRYNGGSYVDKDFSREWINFLLQIHPQEYALYIKEWSAFRKAGIQQDYEQRKKELNAQMRKLNEKRKSDIEYYEEMEKMAEAVISLKDLNV